MRFLGPAIISFALALPVGAIAQADSTSLLYEVSGGGLSKKSYIFGTIHLADKRVFEQVDDKGDSFWVCFKSCDVIAGELDLDEKKLKDEINPQDVLLPGGITLQSLLDSAQYAKVKAYAKEHIGWKAVLIDRMKPFVTASLFTIDMVASDKKDALDTYLQKQGKKQKKAIAGIETAKEQLDAINTVSLKEQADMLVELVNDPQSAKSEMEKMIELYRQRRLMEIYMLMQSSDLNSVIENSIVTRRNYIMADRIEKMMQTQGVFVAIGTGHLPGEEGVLKLLQEKGYSVRAVR